MLSQGELLLLRLLSFFTSVTRVALTSSQHVSTGAPVPLSPAPEEKPAQAKEIKPSSSRLSLWFDYPDSDKEKILAVYKQIGEEPVFTTPSTFPQLLRLILVGSTLLILLFFLYQICAKVTEKKGTV